MAIAVIIILCLILVVLLTVIAYTVATDFTGAPFVPSGYKSVERIIKLAKPLREKMTADLGSGDGRIVLALAKAGAKAHGYEINPLLALWSLYKIKRENLVGKAFIHWKNYWSEDLSPYDVVTVYSGIGGMKKLERKLEKELKYGARVISNIFRFPKWKYLKEDGGILVYTKGRN